MGVYPANKIMFVPTPGLLTVQAAVDRAVATGASWDDPWYIYYHSVSDSTLERDLYTNRPLTSAGAAADGVILVDLDAGLIPRYPEAGPAVTVPKVAVRVDDFRKSWFDTEPGEVLTAVTNPSPWAAADNVEAVQYGSMHATTKPTNLEYVRFDVQAAHAGGLVGVADIQLTAVDINTPGYSYLTLWLNVQKNVAANGSYVPLQFGFTELDAESIVDLETDITWVDLPVTEWAWRPIMVELPAAVKAMTGVKTCALRTVGDVVTAGELIIMLGDVRVNHTGISPAVYAGRKGIPITHCIVTDFIGESGFGDLRDLRHAMCYSGISVACHSKSHGVSDDPPATISEGLDETLGAKEYLEALSDNYGDVTYGGMYDEAYRSINRTWPGTASNKPLGVKVEGYVQPGWGAASVDQPINVDTRQKQQGWFGQLVRSFFKWSQCASAGKGSPTNKHFTSIHYVGNDTTVAQFILEAPKHDVTFMFHGFTGPDDAYYTNEIYRVSYANFKAFIDQLVTWRDAGSVFVCGFDAYMRSSGYHAQSGTTYSLPLLPYGDCGNGTNLTTAKVQNGATPAYPWANGFGGVTVEATGGVDDGPCIKIANHGIVAYKDIPNVVPGRTYVVQYKVKGTGQLNVKVFFSYNTDADTQTLAEQTSYPYCDYFIATNSDFVTHYVTFTVPAWAEKAHLWFGRYGGVTDEFVLIDEVRGCEVN